MTPDSQQPPGDFLEWDSQFFNKRIGSLREHTLSSARMAESLRWAEEQALDCLYLLADTNDNSTIRLAEQHGFHFQSVRTVIECSLSGLDALILPPMAGLILRSSTPDDLERLRPVARHAYTWTRFFSDPCFSRARCEEMYDIWLTKSVHGQMADQVVVAEYHGEAVGYMTCRLGTNGSTEGTFHLLGVDEEKRGMKIGQRVIVEAMVWMAAQGMTRVSLATQGHNVAVIRFYERLGFTMRSMQFWYHKWFSDCGNDEG